MNGSRCCRWWHDLSISIQAAAATGDNLFFSVASSSSSSPSSLLSHLGLSTGDHSSTFKPSRTFRNFLEGEKGEERGGKNKKEPTPTQSMEIGEGRREEAEIASPLPASAFPDLNARWRLAPTFKGPRFPRFKLCNSEPWKTPDFLVF